MWRSVLVSVLAIWCYHYLATQDEVIEKLTIKPNAIETIKPNASYDYVIGKQFSLLLYLETVFNKHRQ